MSQQTEQLMIWDVKPKQATITLFDWYSPDYRSVLNEQRTIYALSQGQFKLIDGVIFLHAQRQKEWNENAPGNAIANWIEENWTALSTLKCQTCQERLVEQSTSWAARMLICRHCFDLLP